MEWKTTVNIKPLIGEDDSEEGAERAGDLIGALLSLKLLVHDQYATDQTLRNIIDGLSNVADVDEFNDVLEDLYDWADENRVWLGLM